MRLSDLVAGASAIVGGVIMYYQNYRGGSEKSKSKARAGRGLIVVGAMLAFGRWMINLVISGH